MSDTKNVKLGVCRIFYDGVDLGYTQGGVEVNVTTETHKVFVDQFGKSVIDEIILGRNVEAKVPLAETTIENMARIMPGSSIVDVGGVAASGTITFSAAAVANDTVTVNGVVFTAKASPVNSNEFGIGSSGPTQAALLADVLKNSENSAVVAAKFTVATNTITVTYLETGTVGNSYTLAKTGTAATVSGATLTGGVDSTHKRIDVPTGVSLSLLEYAKKLVLHPKSKTSTDHSEDFVIPLAATPGALQFAYMLDKERIFNTTFMGYPDPVTENLFYVGD
jgi:hypothetical protein